MIKIFDTEVAVNHFPDGTQNIKIPCNYHTSFIDVVWKYENDAEVITLMYIKKHLDQDYKIINLIMPYIPNARMDRVKNYDEVFSLKHFAEFINSLGFNTIKVLDPHSAVSEALFNNLIIESPRCFISDVLGRVKVDSLFFPDEGSMKRYSSMAELPYTFGIKNRDWKTGDILGLDIAGDVDLIKNKNILIVDDICSRGGTFYFSAKKLKELGAKDIYLYITHCEDTIHQGELLKNDLIKHIWTTDSLLNISHEKITTLNVRRLL